MYLLSYILVHVNINVCIYIPGRALLEVQAQRAQHNFRQHALPPRDGAEASILKSQCPSIFTT